ncbi:cellular tumor antigen p53-like isoform X1 [Panulirus ornatus]|uniref:cellular tumor antigen p53-like isoform X1 n=2 Tax=Panulirus ornatus TaxID=150431 RepID=UPI003A84C5E1
MNYYQDNMQRQDSEPLFGDDIYNLLREDSLLHRTGSANFATLVEGPENSLPVDQSIVSDDPMQPQQHYLEQQDCMQQLAYPHPISNHIVLVPDRAGDLVYPMTIPAEQQAEKPPPQGEQQPPQQQQPHQQLRSADWMAINISDEVAATPSHGQIVKKEEPTSLHEGSKSYQPDTTPSRTVPSLQPWPGRYSFSVSLSTDNKDRNKWCYSQQQDKLYLCPNVAVPVKIVLSEWIDGTLTITPVFKDSRFRIDPVTRCYNCKSQQAITASDPHVAEHIVQIEGEGCDYDVVHERFVVTVPLQPPPPGEVASTLLLKLMCLTSCVGGPNRRPFCLVFTLRNSAGSEIGRQVLDTKCCRCPSRDMTNEEKVANPQVNNAMLTLDDENQAKIRKIVAETKVGQKRKRPNSIKVEPKSDPGYVHIRVPVRHKHEIMSYLNKVLAEEYVRNNNPCFLRTPGNHPQDEN